MIYLAILRRAAPFLLVFALLLAAWGAVRHTQRVYYARGQAEVQAKFDAYQRTAETAALAARAAGDEVTHVLKVAAAAAEGKLNERLKALYSSNRILAADNAGVRSELAAQAAARPRPSNQVTPATCRSDEERARIYAGLLAEGDKLVEEGQGLLGICAAKLTALQEYAQSLKFVEEAR